MNCTNVGIWIFLALQWVSTLMNYISVCGLYVSYNFNMFSYLLTYLLTDWQTDSMQQNPSWEANSHSASQTAHILWNQRFITVFTGAHLSPCITFCNKLVLYGEELLVPCPNSMLEDHPLSPVCDCLFNIFTFMLLDNIHIPILICSLVVEIVILSQMNMGCQYHYITTTCMFWQAIEIIYYLITWKGSMGKSYMQSYC
jgi:hypothetical protein